MELVHGVGFWALFGLVAAPVADLITLAAAALLAAPGAHPGPFPYTRFAVPVPAHNEEAVLGGLLASLEQLDYPRALCAVFVVADNCTDGTSGVARRRRVVVYERHDTDRRGKGHAPQWLLDRVADRAGRYDAFVILDADSRVTPDLSPLSALAAGVAVLGAALPLVPVPGEARAAVDALAAALAVHVAVGLLVARAPRVVWRALPARTGLLPVEGGALRAGSRESAPSPLDAHEAVLPFRRRASFACLPLPHHAESAC